MSLNSPFSHLIIPFEVTLVIRSPLQDNIFKAYEFHRHRFTFSISQANLILPSLGKAVGKDVPEQLQGVQGKLAGLGKNIVQGTMEVGAFLKEVSSCVCHPCETYNNYMSCYLVSIIN